MPTEKYTLLPEVRTEQDYVQYEAAVTTLVASLSREFNQMVEELFPDEFDALLLSMAIEQSCSKYQSVPFKRLDAHYIRTEQRIDCSSTALILGMKWRQKQEGNSVIYFVEKKSAQAEQEDRTVGTGHIEEDLNKKKKKDRASQAHVIVALLPPEVNKSQVYEEYMHLKRHEQTSVLFYHYDYRTNDGTSMVIPFAPNEDLEDFQRIDSDEELLRHRARVYYAPTKGNVASYQAAFSEESEILGEPI